MKKSEAYNVFDYGIVRDSLKKAHLESVRKGGFDSTAQRTLIFLSKDEAHSPGPTHYKRTEEEWWCPSRMSCLRSAQVVVYALLPRGEVVADSMDFPVELGLANKCSLRFSLVSHGLPGVFEFLFSCGAAGSSVELVLNAHPGSMCSMRAIDQSLLLLSPEKELMVESIHSYRTPKGCSVENLAFAKELSVGSGQTPSDQNPPAAMVRRYFPETLIWDLVYVGTSGFTRVNETVPDTITTWERGVFCTSPVGFGVAPKVSLTAFQAFFMSLTLPYSIVRGEVFTLKATIFNYLPSCIMVQVMLESSNQFSAQPCMSCIYTYCLCADNSWTFTWVVMPSMLEAVQVSALCGNRVTGVPEKGHMDTVVQTLLVERNVALKLPKVIVQGSSTAFISVPGDLMGRALQNLDNLLAMPYGCSEQNMLLFAPKIFILGYLESSGQLTPAIRSKATSFLLSDESTHQWLSGYLGDAMVSKSLDCLWNISAQVNVTYAITLLSYTFTLARDQVMRGTLLSHLNQRAVVTVDGQHWGSGCVGMVTDFLDVETTSYVLLAVLSGPLLPKFDLGYSASIIRWLGQQHNAFAGFVSTQDTVVALQALAKYSTATYSTTDTIAASVTSPHGLKTQFMVYQNNRLLYQQIQLQEFTQHYNIPPPNDFSSFSISFNTTSNCSAPNLSVGVTVTVRTETDMVVIEVKLLSGFSLVEGSLIPVSGSIAENATVKHVDQMEINVVIYLNGHPASQCPVSGQQARRPPGQDKFPEGHSGLQPPLLHRVVAELSGTELKRETPIQRKVTLWTDQLLATLQDALDDTDWDMFQCSNDDVSEFMEAVVGFIGIPRATNKKFPNLKPWVDKTIHEALNSHTATCNAGIIGGN
ncbi:hypothetical protein P4O66_004459 [Electrophorus voltai]|uniref:Alpha-2-macroglobulin domain-containing protein n=1 Tax=Electrophorus voltai TaxID=2609070 RepID=A0AAD8ZPZ4_9TELE|nr:hypothetical protein P4O66_004459 [Electrophorus voltai]